MALTMYEQIAKNRRNTFLLIAAMSALFLAVGYVLGLYFFGNPYGGLILAGGVAMGMSLFSYFSGDSVLLAVSGARRIRKEDHPQLFNVVEELSLAAGIPMPKVYLIEDEAPNAFATGRDPEHASVAITTGLLRKLNRDELQGVMAHELAHVTNRDILYAMMVAVLAGSIVMLADFTLRYMFWFGGGRRRDSRDGGGGGVIVLLGLVLAILAPLFATLIQLAVSRQREYLADATAVKLTRYPEGLASALEKLANDTHELRYANRATAHLYIVNPFPKLRRAAAGAWSTHPPLEERIRRLRQLS